MSAIALPGEATAARDNATTSWWLGCAAGLASVPLARQVEHTDADVSWLLVAAGRMIDGAVPYRDIIEPNPPASILLYIPAVLLARCTGLSPAVACDIVVAALLLGSFALAAHILGRAGLIGRAERARAWCLAVPILLLLPLGSFGQREHMVFGALLPCIASLAARRRGFIPATVPLVAVALLAGAAVALKPIFALALAGPAILAMRGRPWRDILKLHELWIAAAVVIAYGAAVALLLPDYASRMLPLLIEVYLPARTPFGILLALPTTALWFALLASYWQVDHEAPLGQGLALASIGFLACYFIQGKGFAYHGLPAVMAAGLAMTTALARRLGAGGDRTRLLIALFPAAVALPMAVGQYGYQVRVPRLAPGLVEAIGAIAPHPRLLAIGTSGELGAGLAEDVGGTFVARTPITWVSLYASLIIPRPERDPRFRGLIGEEKGRTADDIARERPDIIVVDDDAWLGWAQRDSRLVAALDDYTDAGRFGKALLLRRMPRETQWDLRR